MEIVDVDMTVVAPLDFKHLLLQGARGFVQQLAVLIFELEVFSFNVFAFLVPGELFLLAWLGRRSFWLIGVFLAVFIPWLFTLRWSVDEACDARSHVKIEISLKK